MEKTFIQGGEFGEIEALFFAWYCAVVFI